MICNSLNVDQCTDNTVYYSVMNAYNHVGVILSERTDSAKRDGWSRNYVRLVVNSL